MIGRVLHLDDWLPDCQHGLSPNDLSTHTSHQQVLRLHDLFTQFDEAVALMDYFAESAADGRWDRLRVLDLTDCVLGDIGVLRLAAAIEAGFGKSLEELDLSFNRNTGRYVRLMLGRFVFLHVRRMHRLLCCPFKAKTL